MIKKARLISRLRLHITKSGRDIMIKLSKIDFTVIIRKKCIRNPSLPVLLLPFHRQFIASGLMLKGSGFS